MVCVGDIADVTDYGAGSVIVKDEALVVLFIGFDASHVEGIVKMTEVGVLL